MSTKSTRGSVLKAPVIRFDAVLMAEDAALKGWSPTELARQAGITDMTAIRFLRNERQTAKSAKKLASALGYSPRRYLISARSRSRVA